LEPLPDELPVPLPDPVPEPLPEPLLEPLEVVVVAPGATEPPQPAANPRAMDKIKKKTKRTKSPHDPSLDLHH
jgi:hypothetical protein